MKLVKLKSPASVLVPIFLVAAFPSWLRAHAFPIRSEPRVGWTVTTSPSKVIIWFDSELEPVFSTIEVHNSAKQRVDKGNSRVSSSDATVLEVDLPALASGTYRVFWRALSKDTHVTEGDFSFTVAAK